MVPAFCEPSQSRNRETPCLWRLSAGHGLLEFHHPHVGPSGRDSSDLPPGAGGPQWQRQLPVLLSIWPIGGLGCLGSRVAPC